MHTRAAFLVSPLLLAILLASPAAAQQNTGQIVGTIRDASGVIPGAPVEVTHDQTGVARATTSNAEGHYEFSGLLPGTYTLQVVWPGFKTAIHRGIVVDAGARVRQDVLLTVGAVTENVTVEGGTAVVDTETSAIGTVVTSEQIAETMLNGRNYVKLAMLVPGAVYVGGADELTGTGPLGNPGAPVAINGMDNKMNSWNLDGARNVNLGNGEGNFFIPPLDSIREVQIQTTGYSAEHGSTAGAVVNVVTKSGTQEYKGSAYEYLRDDSFDARNAFSFNDRDGDGKADPGELSQHNFGYSIGGPVVLPGYDRGSSRTFFFWNHEWLRRRDGAQTILTATPTAAMREGDFSAEVARTGMPLIDPETGLPFPGNGIPADRINSNAALILERYFPLPNNPAGGFQNFQNNAVRELNQWAFTTRIDHQFSPSVQLWGKWGRSRNEDLFPNAALLGGTPFPTLRRDFQTKGDTVTVQLDTALSNSVFNQLNFSWLRGNIILNVIGDGGATVSRPPGLTIRGFFPDADPLNIIPNISFSGGWGSMGTGVLPLPEARIDHYTLKEDFSIARGDHSLRFGGLIWRYEQNQWTFNGAQGSYQFNGRFTNHPIGDFLLGMANTYTQRNANFPVNYRFTQFEAYAQDNWRARDDLTLNLGIRIFRIPMISVRGNRASSFTPELFDPAKAPVVLPNGLLQETPDYDPLNGLAIAGQGVPDGFADATIGWAPRLGFAYDVFGDARLAIRGGYGVGFQNYGNDFSSLSQQIPFLSNIVLESVPFDDPTGGNASPAAPQAVSGMDPDFKRPYSQNWSLGVQAELPWSMIGLLAYVGNKYSRGEQWLNVNQPMPVDGFDFDPRLNARTVNINTIRPFPGYGDITFFTFGAESRYDALQASVQRRFDDGFALQASYTLSRAKGTTSGNRDARYQNSYDPEADHGYFPMDRRHSFVVNYIYELPFLRGRNDLLGAVLGGWSLSGLATFQSGLALTPGLTGGNIGLATRPDLTGEPIFNEGTRTEEEWFNREAFTQPAPGFFGNAGVGIIRGPGFQIWDMALSKSFAIPVGTRTTRATFRIEAFNVFNHVNYNGVNTTLGSGSYGRVTSVREPRQLQLSFRYEF